MMVWLIPHHFSLGKAKHPPNLLFILDKAGRWLVDDKKRNRKMEMGRMSSTVVAFVRGLAEADVPLKRGLWLRGRWHSAKSYETVQPIRR